MVICLGRSSPTASSSLPAAHRCRWGRCGPHLAAYLALLRLGVAVPSLLPATRWALTPPFHPYPPALAHPRAVCFLLPCPSPCGAQALPGSLPCGARTFLGCRSTRDHRACPGGEYSALELRMPGVLEEREKGLGTRRGGRRKAEGQSSELPVSPSAFPPSKSSSPLSLFPSPYPLPCTRASPASASWMNFSSAGSADFH